MIQPLSANTQAILMLTAPLITGRDGPRAQTLTPGEYKRLAQRLRDIGRQPADMIGPAAEATIADCESVAPRERLQGLLGRGFMLSQAVERWNARAIWVISRADAIYPKRWKTRLHDDCPPVLYGCGDPNLLVTGGLAVVGSREVTEDILEFAGLVGRSAAEAGITVVSGGARGIDDAAMSGCLDAGGRGCSVLADSLAKHALEPSNRGPLAEGRLALVSPYDPAARFNVGHAMGRNKLMYALADRGLVVNCEPEKGGTWAGAIEQLNRYRWFPIFVRAGGESPIGNQELVRRGGVAWRESPSAQVVRDMITSEAPQPAEPKQDRGLFPNEEVIDEATAAVPRRTA